MSKTAGLQAADKVQPDFIIERATDGPSVAFFVVLWDTKTTSIQIVLTDQESAHPPQVTRLLRASPFVEDCSGRYFF